MNETETLDRLAGMAGIRPFYWDIFGGYHEATPDGKRAILAALGYPAGTPEEMRDSLRALERRTWGRWLAPTTVLRRGQEMALDLAIPASLAEGTFLWTLALEDGTTKEGRVVPAELEVTETHDGDGGTVERRRLALPPGIPDGYHRISLKGADVKAEAHLILAPSRCFVPAWAEKGPKRWGLGAHLYALRTRDDWGIGDFSGLAKLTEAAGRLGAATVGVNPLHALFPDLPEHASPYSPSSRLFLNPVYIDVTAAPGFGHCPAVREKIASKTFADRLESIRSEPHVDYAAVTRLKREILEELWAWFADHPSSEQEAFEAFIAERGESLRRFCLHEALREHFKGKEWPDWPKAYRDPTSKQVAAFAQKHPDRVDFQAWQQWVAETQLGNAAKAGAAVGLYRDLAVGADRAGADAWAARDLVVQGGNFGAPPDAFNPLGQDWGLPPLHPHALKERGYLPFRDMLRANMRHANALRIDHVMGLMHLYWVPAGADARDGAYVHYPFDDLLGVVALESRRNQCLIVGEDLGTVPDGFRERMTGEGILSYRLLFFERWESGLFKRPDAYPSMALATATTHDLPTVAGYWKGTDLDLRRSLGLFHSAEAMEGDLAGRQDERHKLIAALEDQEILPDGIRPEAHLEPDRLEALTLAVERYVARTESCLLMINLDDLLCELDQLNLPGTILEYPNWRRRLSQPVETLFERPFVREVLRAVVEERLRPTHS